MCILAALWIVTQRELHAAASPVRDVLADYDAELRRPDGRVDVDAMAARLKELGVTSYYWLIWHAATDWDDLKLFLPKAAQAGIAVTVYLVPPSESPPQYGSQVFRAVSVGLRDGILRVCAPARRPDFQE